MLEAGRMEWRVIDSKLVLSFGVLRSEALVYDASKDILRVELTPGQGDTVRFIFSGERAQQVEFGNRVFTRKLRVPCNRTRFQLAINFLASHSRC